MYRSFIGTLVLYHQIVKNRTGIRFRFHRLGRDSTHKTNFCQITQILVSLGSSVPGFWADKSVKRQGKQRSDRRRGSVIPGCVFIMFVSCRKRRDLSKHCGQSSVSLVEKRRRESGCLYVCTFLKVCVMECV